MRYLMGSAYFFGTIETYTIKDRDYIELSDNPNITYCANIKSKIEDIFIFRRKSKEAMIADALKATLPMVVGKFLIKEFCDEIGFTVSDLLLLEPQFAKLDQKHVYEKIIRDSYLENNGFYLTEEQRIKAYNCYLASRV